MIAADSPEVTVSYEDGWAAINLERPRRIPRTEYSAASYHWPLIARVTGLPVSASSSVDEKAVASRAFMKAWRYDFCWSTMVGGAYLGPYQMSMGHAVYAADGSDLVTGKAAAFRTPQEVLAFDPATALPACEHADLVERFNGHYRANVAAFPDAVNMTGTYITVVSGLIDLLGWDLLLLTAGTDAEAFGRFTNRYADWMLRFYTALAESEAPLVMVHDDIVWTSGPFISPEWYREFVFPNYRRYFARSRRPARRSPSPPTETTRCSSTTWRPPEWTGSSWSR